MNQSTVVKEHEFIDPDIDEVDYLLDKVIKHCREKYFHSFEHGCVYDIKFTKLTNNDEAILPISLDYMDLNLNTMG